MVQDRLKNTGDIKKIPVEYIERMMSLYNQEVALTSVEMKSLMDSTE